MGKFRRLASYASLATLLTVTGLIAGGSAAYADGNFGSCSAQGDFAICDASGTANNPITITVTVTASPDQSVDVSWADTCAQGDGAGSSSGSFTATTPVTRTISHPYYQPDNCVVAAGAQLSNTGSVTVTLSYSSHAGGGGGGGGGGTGRTGALKGYAGMCAQPAGGGSAIRTKVQVDRCNGSAAQKWKYVSGHMQYAGMCMNAKGTATSGSRVILYPCNGSQNEVWLFNTITKELMLKAHNFTLCLTDPGKSTRNGTQLKVATCVGAPGQIWQLA